MKELLEIQQKLVAKKDKFNSFGKYHYRSAEGILESLKPLLKEQGCTLTLTDEVVQVGNSNYVKASASIQKGEKYCNVSAYAREAVTKKGMDDAQITGSASSYARKYALSGLFAIDDGNCPDATNDHGKGPQSDSKPPKASTTQDKGKAQKVAQEVLNGVEGDFPKISTGKAANLRKRAKDMKKGDALDAILLADYNLTSTKDLTDAQWDEVLAKLKAK